MLKLESQSLYLLFLGGVPQLVCLDVNVSIENCVKSPSVTLQGFLQFSCSLLLFLEDSFKNGYLEHVRDRKSLHACLIAELHLELRYLILSQEPASLVLLTDGFMTDMDECDHECLMFDYEVKGFAICLDE